MLSPSINLQNPEIEVIPFMGNRQALVSFRHFGFLLGMITQRSQLIICNTTVVVFTGTRRKTTLQFDTGKSEHSGGNTRQYFISLCTAFIPNMNSVQEMRGYTRACEQLLSVTGKLTGRRAHPS